jgi:hypothetical protein
MTRTTEVGEQRRQSGNQTTRQTAQSRIQQSAPQQPRDAGPTTRQCRTLLVMDHPRPRPHTRHRSTPMTTSQRPSFNAVVAPVLRPAAAGTLRAPGELKQKSIDPRDTAEFGASVRDPVRNGLDWASLWPETGGSNLTCRLPEHPTTGSTYVHRACAAGRPCV